MHASFRSHKVGAIMSICLELETAYLSRWWRQLTTIRKSAWCLWTEAVESRHTWFHVRSKYHRHSTWGLRAFHLSRLFRLTFCPNHISFHLVLPVASFFKFGFVWLKPERELRIDFSKAVKSKSSKYSNENQDFSACNSPYDALQDRSLKFLILHLLYRSLQN